MISMSATRHEQTKSKRLVKSILEDKACEERKGGGMGGFGWSGENRQEKVKQDHENRRDPCSNN